MSVKILIVDDHYVVREGVRSLLNSFRPEWSTSEAQDATQAFEAVQSQKPDLVIMDITMPDFSGLELASRLRSTGFDRPILMFTMHKSEQLGNDSRQAGAQGYVLKSQAVEDLVKAIDILLAGGTFYGKRNASEIASKSLKPGLSFYVALAPAFG
jgi:two-component system nitrate/nitrite response regulator NarL